LSFAQGVELLKKEVNQENSSAGTPAKPRDPKVAADSVKRDQAKGETEKNICCNH
jgi:hypothetical protein